MKKLEKKRKKLEDFQESYSAETGAKLNKLNKEIDSLKSMLSKPKRTCDEPALPDVVTEASSELLKFIEKQIGDKELKFIERQIEDAEKDLECPVCFEIAEAPIFKWEEEMRPECNLKRGAG